MVDASGTRGARDLEQELEGLILSGQLAAGQRMPTVRQLARDYEGAPGTVVKAYSSLSEKGLLITTPRRGTVVAETATTPSFAVLTAVSRLAQALRAEGLDVTVGQRLLSVVWRSSE